MVRTTGFLVSALALMACSPAEMYQQRAAQYVQNYNRQWAASLPISQRCDPRGAGTGRQQEPECRAYFDQEQRQGNAEFGKMYRYQQEHMIGGPPPKLSEEWVQNHLPELNYRSCLGEIRQAHPTGYGGASACNFVR